MKNAKHQHNATEAQGHLLVRVNQMPHYLDPLVQVCICRNIDLTLTCQLKRYDELKITTIRPQEENCFTAFTLHCVLTVASYIPRDIYTRPRRSHCAFCFHSITSPLSTTNRRPLTKNVTLNYCRAIPSKSPSAIPNARRNQFEFNFAFLGFRG